ncbi:MAG: GTPase RsgA [Acidobacteria bacterium]|nr:GTPase RsgA [Acidobacteriota bacterium]
MNLISIGWRDSFAQQLLSFPDCIAGRVALTHRERYVVWTEDGEIEASPSGRMRQTVGLWPTTGDWVALRPGGSIEAVLERQTVIVRKQPGKAMAEQVLAANLDVLFVVAGLDHDFNPRRIERYLMLAQEGGVRPVLILNKADLLEDPSDLLRQAKELAGGCPVVVMSAQSGWGVKELEDYVSVGETAALAGSSGVGKCWLLMDLPGIRELQLVSGVESVPEVFDDVELAAKRCRFRNCKHENEKGCAVVGTIDPARIAAFHKLKKEAAHAERQVDQIAALKEKKRVKVIHKAMRDRDDWD